MARRTGLASVKDDGTFSTVERALQLARSGSYDSITMIRQVLIKERYWDVEAELSGPSIKSQLLRLIAEAKTQRP